MRAVQEPVVRETLLNADLSSGPPLNVTFRNFLHMVEDRTETEEPVSINADEGWPSMERSIQFRGCDRGTFERFAIGAGRPPGTTCFPEGEGGRKANWAA